MTGHGVVGNVRVTRVRQIVCCDYKKNREKDPLNRSDNMPKFVSEDLFYCASFEFLSDFFLLSYEERDGGFPVSLV